MSGGSLPKLDRGSAEAVRAAARAHDFDRYLAALLAPSPVQPALLAVAAFLGDAARIPHLVGEPMMGEIRLQWWRDTIEDGAQREEPTGNPIADALEIAIRSHDLPREDLLGVLDARTCDLYANAVDGVGELEAYLDLTEVAGFRLAARILDVADEERTQGVCTAAGRAYGLVRLLLALPLHRHRGRMPFPDVPAGETGLASDATFSGYAQRSLDLLGEARRGLRGGKPRLVKAILPAALVPAYGKAWRTLRGESADTMVDIGPMTRIWTLLAAALRGRV